MVTMGRISSREKFAADRRERWARLEGLVRLAEHGRIQQFSAAELYELGSLYRGATSDLAIARRDFPQDHLTTFLNNLVARAHPVVYRDRPQSIRQVRTFALYGFPAAVRTVMPYMLVAAGIFFLAALVSGIIVALDPTAADSLLPGQAQDLRSVMGHHHLWVQQATENHSVAANFIMLNNIKVAILAFAFGILAEVPTILLLAENGINLGAVGAMVQQYNLSAPFWAFVAPHGVIELSVIFMAGGAGMMIGDAVLRPGLRRRSDALTDSARVAAQVLAGCIPLLIIAGTIEGFFSPSDSPLWLKAVVATILFAALYTYLLGSRPRSRDVPYHFEDVAPR